MKATNRDEHFAFRVTRLSEKRRAQTTSSDMYVVIHHPESFPTGKTLRGLRHTLVFAGVDRPRSLNNVFIYF